MHLDFELQYLKNYWKLIFMEWGCQMHIIDFFICSYTN